MCIRHHLPRTETDWFAGSGAHPYVQEPAPGCWVDHHVREFAPCASISSNSLLFSCWKRCRHLSERVLRSSGDMVRGSSFLLLRNLLVTCSSFALAGDCSPDF